MSIKTVLNFLCNEFIYGSHLISIGAVSIILSSATLLNVNVTWDFLMIVYLTSQIIYTHNHLKENKIDFLTNPERSRHVEKSIKYISHIIFIYVIFIVILFFSFSRFPIFIYWLGLIFLGLLYSKIFKKITKNIFFFKNLFVSLMWTSLILIFLLYYGYEFDSAVFLLSIFVFLRMMMHEIFSDIRDIDGDIGENLLTLPTVFGKERTLVIINILNILSIVPLLIGIYYNLFPLYTLLICLIVFYSLFYIKQIDDKKKYLYNIIADGEFILWYLFIFVGKSLL